MLILSLILMWFSRYTYQRHILNSLKHLKGSFLREYLTAKSRKLFLQKALRCMKGTWIRPCLWHNFSLQIRYKARALFLIHEDILKHQKNLASTKVYFNWIHWLKSTLSWRRPLSYRNQSIDLRCKSMDWFLYDNGFRHERVNQIISCNLF